MNHLDSRALPASWPAALRERTEKCRAVRDNPVLKCLVEGLAIAKSTGWAGGFTEHVAVEYIRKHLGDGGVENYLATDFASRTEDLVALAETAWCATPLTVGLTLTHDLGQAYASAPHVRLISDALVDGVSGRGPRTVIVSLPSRYGKSETAARRALTWFFANYGGYPAIYASSTDELGTRMGRLVKNDLELHKERIGVQLADDSAAASRFNTTIEGGEMIATGILGQIGGFGAALMVLDDLFKNSEQAGSATYRGMVWELWHTALQNRLQAGAVCVVIGTRFHSQDLAGRLLTGDPDSGVEPIECRYIRLPALADQDGDEVGRKKDEPLPLGPVAVPGFGYSRAELEQRRATTSTETWLSAYQQDPQSLERALRVYHRFDPARHVRECNWDDSARQTTKGMRVQDIWVGCDYNVAPMSALFATINESWAPLAHLLTPQLARLFAVEVIDEIQIDNAVAGDLAEAIIAWTAALSKRFGAIPVLRLVGDASGNNRSAAAATANDTAWKTLSGELARAAGRYYKMRPDPLRRNPPLSERIDMVNGLLEKKQMVVSPRCRGLITDLKELKYKQDRNNQKLLVDHSDAARGHAIDALSYGLWQGVGRGGRFGGVADSTMLLGGGVTAR
jgi:hypothetical protein